MASDSNCESGEVRSCATLGEIFAAGEEVARNVETAMLYRSEACAKHDAVSCRELARLLLAGRQRDGAYAYERPARLLERACSWGEKTSCDELSALQAAPR